MCWLQVRMYNALLKASAASDEAVFDATLAYYLERRRVMRYVVQPLSTEVRSRIATPLEFKKHV